MDRLALCGKSGRPTAGRIKGSTDDEGYFWTSRPTRRSNSPVDLFSIQAHRREMGSLVDCLLLPNKAAAWPLSSGDTRLPSSRGGGEGEGEGEEQWSPCVRSTRERACAFNPTRCLATHSRIGSSALSTSDNVQIYRVSAG